MIKQPILFVKLGGSLITDKNVPFTPRRDVISRLIGEINQARKQCREYIIVTHGSGSYSHSVAIHYEFAKGIKHKNNLFGAAHIHHVCSLLNNIIVEKFLSQGIAAVTVSPSSALVTKSRQIKSLFLQSLLLVINNQLLPVMYGDAIWDSELGCIDFSTESVIEAYAKALLESDISISQVIYCGITDGVYDENKKTIPYMSPTDYKIPPDFVQGSESVDTTGGMRHKLEVALRMSELGVPSHIVNGNRNGELFGTLVARKHHGTVVAKI